jgi:hypothetical protein
MPPRDGTFFVAVVLGPPALVVPFVLPGNVWTWAIVVAGGLALLDCLRRVYEAYYMTPRGLVRRRVGGRDELAWSEIEVVGENHLRTRFGIVGTIVHAYAKSQVFRLMLDTTAAPEFLRLVGQHCPQALWIDEDRWAFDVPAGVETERVRELVAQHTRRLRRKHAWAVGVSGLALVPAIVVVGRDLAAGRVPAEYADLPLFCGVAFMVLAWGHLAALWRLRK